MSLPQWLENSWIREITPSRQCVADLLAVAEREIRDASLPGMSIDGKFDHSYDAVRSLCELALHAEGYTIPKGGRKHERAIESLSFTLGEDWTEQVDFLDQCRRLRHKTMYERCGVVQEKDANDLLSVARELSDDIQAWLKKHHADLCGEG